MILVLKPIGRGRWRTMEITIDERRVPPMVVSVGQKIQIGDVVFRICEIRP